MIQMQTLGLDELDARLRLTAAVSTTFDPLQLSGQPTGVLNALAAVCDEVDVPGMGYRQWQMRGEARREVLRPLIQRADIDQILDSVRIPPDDLFATHLVDGLRGEDLGRLVTPGETPGAAKHEVDLDRLLQAVRLLDDLRGQGSPYGEVERLVRRRIALKDADDALRAVIPARLIGREEEYQELVDFRKKFQWDGAWVPSLVIEGPGGVGKSALVSTFVYDQRRDPRSAPLSYLDFDRAMLIGARPVDLTIEFARQLGLAEDALEPMLAEFRERSRGLLGDDDPSVGIDANGGSAAAALRDLGSLLAGWPRRQSAVTIVLDTFEELATRGFTAVQNVLQWAAELRDALQLPQLRLVVCGRAVFPDAPHLAPEDVRVRFNVVRHISVGDLSDGDATELLVELGLDPMAAREFPPVFGGNPLVLKLIRRFAATNDDGAVARLIADGRLARSQSPAAEIGLRFVYERILNRIESPRVRALAYPGVVLRRVTPELILRVLAPASSMALDVSTIDEAWRVFTELAEHVWLVNRINEGVVEHRADVRRLLVPGLETSAEIDTAEIHRRAASYYASRPAGIDVSTIWLEEIYHRGFIEDVFVGMSRMEADDIVRMLGADLEFWPLRTRASVKASAGRYDTLTEEEVASLDVEDQVTTRDARIASYRSWGDTAHAHWEESQLVSVGTIETIPDSRWLLLFDRGEFDFMAESARALRTLDRYFAVRQYSPRPTHEHPWYIALARLMLNTRDALLSESSLHELQWQSVEQRLYAAALAALGGDRFGHERVLGDLTRAGRGSRTGFLGTVDAVLIFQAATSEHDDDELDYGAHVSSYDHFRLSHLAEIAAAAGDSGTAQHLANLTQEYVKRRPETTDLNRLRATLTNLPSSGEAHWLRAAPTPLAFFYGAIRATLEVLDRTSILEIVAAIEDQSVFWPVDQTAADLDRTIRSFSPSTLTGLVETADQCGLLTDLVDSAASRANTQLAHQLVPGIRRVENLLFPLARPRGDLLSFR